MNTTAMTPWQRLMGLLKLEKRAVLQVFYYAIFSGLVSLSLPLGIQTIINLLQSAQITTSWILLVVLVTLGVAFVGVLQLMQLRIVETIQQRIFTRATFEFTYRLPKIKMEELHNQYPPELANRFFDTLTVQKGMSKILIDVPAALLQIIFALILLSFYHPFFIVFGILLLGLIYVVFKFTARRGMETSLDESKKKYKVAYWVQEVARTLISFKLSGQTSLSLQRNDDLVMGYLDARESHFKMLVIQFIQMIGFKVIVTAGLLTIGGALVLNQQMNIGQFVAAEIIILLVIAAVEKLITALETFYDILTSLNKIGEVVDKELEPQSGEKPVFNSDFTMELKDISYVAPKSKNTILSHINFTIKANTRLLIKGENGAGKSTFLKLIGGVLQPTHGNLFLDMYSLKNININHYRKHIGLSLSEETPFEGTIRNNITFGNSEISDSDVYVVAKQIGLEQFIKMQAKGLDTILYPEGRGISFTIAKKIVLARAIVKKPRVLILENSLDYFEESEAIKIMDFLSLPEHSWSLVVVSQHPRWESVCTHSIELKNGSLIEKWL